MAVSGQQKPLVASQTWLPKRLFDIFFSIIFLLVFAPLFVGIAAAVRIESRGPIFFLQRRGGYLNEPFTIIKFRTMRDCDAFYQETARDPRITRIGGMLRTSGFDEIPQLINVLRGEMSLVGPRPHAWWHDDQCKQMPGYNDRYLVKPGLTGLAQVHGLRGAISGDRMHDRVVYDLEYVREQSMRLDMIILLKTFRLLLPSRDAR